MGTHLAATERERRSTARQLQPRLPVGAFWTGRPGGRRRRALRRLLAACLMIGAGWAATWGDAGRTGSPVVTAALDLPLGTVLTADDLRVSFLAGPPDGALSAVDAAVGRRLAGAVRRGEVLTDRRLIGDAGPDPGPGRVAVAVRPDDPALVSLLEPGMSVSVIGITEGGNAQVLTDSAFVLAVLDESDDRAPPLLLSVAISEADAVTVAALTGDVALRFPRQ